MMQLCLNMFLLAGYICLTLMVWKSNHQDNDMISYVSCFIFIVQQLHLIIRFDPLHNDKVQVEFRDHSQFQLIVFVCLIGTFLDVKSFLIPTVLIYSTVFWAVYCLTLKCDILWYEATFKYFSIILVISGILITLYPLLEIKEEPLIKFIENKVVGLMIFDKNFCQLYCNSLAKKLLHFPDES